MTMPNAFGSRGSLGPGLPDYYRLSALAGVRPAARRRPRARARHPQDPARERAAPRRRRHRARGGRGDPRRPGARAARARPRSRSCPARVVLQDFTGVPAVVDLAAMRDAMAALGGDPARVNPLVPADLVIDHSVQIDAWGGAGAFAFNVGREYERNGERYQLLRWAQTAFRDLRVVPPGTGIIHQVNLEFLAAVVADRADEGGRVAFPDTLVGHRLPHHDDQRPRRPRLRRRAASRPRPSCWASRSTSRCPASSASGSHGELPKAATATDLVLVITEMLRKFGVVGAFVEFAGDGLAGLSLADRATISNMSPEFGATTTMFPIDDETLAYLRLTGRPRRAGRARRALRQGPGPVARARRRPRVRRPARARPGHRRARRWPARAGPRTGWPWAACRTTSGPPTRTPWASRPRPSRPAARRRRSGTARSPSPPSPPAPTPRTRP